MSNKVQGEKTFEGRNLHEISEERLNPYQEVQYNLFLQPITKSSI